MKTSKVVTVDDLRSGRVARINTHQYAALKGNSVYTHQRNRVLGKGIPFQKDESGRVWYRAEDVLAELDAPVHRSTREFDTSVNLERLTKAREVLARDRSA